MTHHVLHNLWKKRNAALVLAAACALTFNILATHKELSSFSKKRKASPYRFLGNQFEGLRDLLDRVPQVGYHTDKSLDNALAAATFAQAQYTLAPTLLKLDAVDAPFVIFDYADTQQALKKIAAEGLQAVRINPSGMILTRNPRYK